MNRCEMPRHEDIVLRNHTPLLLLHKLETNSYDHILPQIPQGHQICQSDHLIDISIIESVVYVIGKVHCGPAGGPNVVNTMVQ